MIRCDQVSVRVGDVVALPPTSLDLADGERVFVAGPNGSGKTTLLRVLAGLLTPTSGSVSGRPARGDVVLVHQRPHLFHGTVRHNVEIAARLARAAGATADDPLDHLGLRAIADRDVRVLSGGERRRVAIARALARAPRVLLLDEPFAELDPDAAARVHAAVAAFVGTVVTASPAARPPFDARVVTLPPRP